MLPFSGWLDLVRQIVPDSDAAPPNRFLRARKFDVVKAKEMLLNAEKWRTDFGVEEIMKSVLSSECSFLCC